MHCRAHDALGSGSVDRRDWGSYRDHYDGFYTQIHGQCDQRESRDLWNVAADGRDPIQWLCYTFLAGIAYLADGWTHSGDQMR